jgi:pSer/pThr/pTyr-binding forkhead associated (FHA) protein
MSLKSLFNKFSGKKEDVPEGEQPTPEHEEVIEHEISFNKMETRVETLNAVAEIDVYVDNEKTNIHTLATETRIGRDPSQSDIIISELIVSKLHCTIYNEGGNYYIRDENSTNGLYIGDERIDTRLLQNGDTILLGKKGTVYIIFHRR